MSVQYIADNHKANHMTLWAVL